MTAVLIVLGLVLARRRGPALAGTAVVALVGLGLLWLGLGVGREAYLAELPAAVPEAAGAAYFDILTADLRTLIGYVAAGAAVAAVLGAVGGAIGGRRVPEPDPALQVPARLHDPEPARDVGAVGVGRVGRRVGAGAVEVAEGGRLVDEHLAGEVLRERDPGVERGVAHGRDHLVEVL